MEKRQPDYGHGKICYLEMPSLDITESSSFYEKVFGWQTRKRDNGSIAFDDGVGQVSGTWVKKLAPSNPGILIYIMIDDIDETIKLIKLNGGTITQEVGMDAPEITARFTDPAGNTMGLYQPREIKQ